MFLKKGRMQTQDKDGLKRQLLSATTKSSETPVQHSGQSNGLGSISPSQRDVLELQRTIGNQAVGLVLSDSVAATSLKRELVEQSTAHRPHVPTLGGGPSRSEEVEARAGSEEGIPVVGEAKTAMLEPGELSPWGDMDGRLSSDVVPHVFVNGGKTGSARDNTVGGAGGTGNQPVGDITLVAPVYESSAPLGDTPAKAWIRPGTGRATVTRSYTGSLVGANGPTLYMTAAAVARTDQHEELHVNSSESIHNTHIVPLEARIARHEGQANAMSGGGTAAQAETALRNFINWNTTIAAFRAADTAANTPMGTVDVADLASPTFPVDYGPCRVGGVNYANYFDVPPGPGATCP